MLRSGYCILNTANGINKIKQLDPEKLVEPFKSIINTMDFETKQFTARKIVDKIVATKEKVVIHGFIPVLDAPTDRKVKLSAIYRHSEVVTQLPFELKLTMPPTDRGKRGYSDSYISKIHKAL